MVVNEWMIDGIIIHLSGENVSGSRTLVDLFTILSTIHQKPSLVDRRVDQLVDELTIDDEYQQSLSIIGSSVAPGSSSINNPFSINHH